MNTLIIKFAGVPDLLMLPDVIEVSVDTNVFLPSMCTILVKDHSDVTTGALTYSDNILKIGIGTPFDVSIDSDSGLLSLNKIFSGEITSVEPVFRDDGEVFLRIRGYDLSHRLTYGKKTRTFGSGSPMMPTATDNMIVSKIAAEYGLIPAAQSTTLKYNYVMQYNQSDWEFLQSRARQLGFQLYVDGRKLHFKDSSATRHLKGPDKLIWGSNLNKFEPRLATAGTVTTVEAYGWDSDAKKEVKGSKSNGKSAFAKIGESTFGSGMMHKKMMLKPEEVIIDSEITSSGQANKVAAARMDELESQFVRASGELDAGDPFLLAGTNVVIAGVGVRFSGKYYVSEARHVWRQGSYKVYFQVSGRNPHTFRSLLTGNGESESSQLPSTVIGVVTNISDPENLGRVRVKFPWMPKLMGGEMESMWARVTSIGGGSGRGIVFLPEVDDEVLIAFEGGDINTPVVIGTLWNKKDKLPAGNILDPGKKKVNERIIRSRSGHVITLDDSQGAEKITIMDKTGKNSIEIDSKTNAMTFKTQGDFTIDAGGKFIVKSKMDMMLDSKGKSGFKATSGMELDCAAGTKVKAGSSMLDLTAASAALKSTKVDVQANAAASIKGSAMVEIQGGIVKIN